MVSSRGNLPRPLLVFLISLLATASYSQVPNIPAPGSLRPPTAPPPPPPSPVAVPQVPATQPAGVQPVSTAQVSVPPGGVIITNNTNTTRADGLPSLDQCGGAISRMVGLFVFEILAEFLFSILRFLVLTERLDWDVMKLAIIRLVYTIFPVIPFNFSCLWWGTGPKGSCLTAHQPIKVIFTLLLFYCMYSCLDATFLLIQGREEDDDSDYYSDYGSEYSRRNWRRRRRRSESGSGTVSDDESSEPKLIEKIFPFLQR